MTVPNETDVMRSDSEARWWQSKYERALPLNPTKLTDDAVISGWIEIALQEEYYRNELERRGARSGMTREEFVNTYFDRIRDSER
jgi:hypothetical protein